jgi:hypothetical protein
MRNLVELADGEYALEKEKARRCGRPHSVTIQIINKRFGLKNSKLRNYRANNYSRKR